MSSGNGLNQSDNEICDKWQIAKKCGKQKTVQCEEFPESCFLFNLWIDSLPQNLDFNNLEKEDYKNIVGKGENAGHQHFFPFSNNVFYSSKKNFKFSITCILSSVNAFNLDQSKILSFGKALT